METLFTYIPLVDSNILISFLIRDPNFESSESVLKKAAYINDFIICETLNFLQHKISFSMSQKVEEKFFEKNTLFHRIEISSEILEKACEIRRYYADNELQFTDAVLLAQAERYNLTLYTRDKKMLNYKQARVICP